MRAEHGIGRACAALCLYACMALGWVGGATGQVELRSAFRVMVWAWERDALAQHGIGANAALDLITSAELRIELLSGSGVAVRRYEGVPLYVVEGRSAFEADVIRQELHASGLFRCVWLDRLIHPAAHVGNDPLVGSQWQLAAINAPEAWETWRGSGAITLAVVDTGILPTHPDLAPVLLAGYNSVHRLAQSAGGAVSDVNGHGTSVAGAAGAVGDNGVGGAGVGWGFGIIPVRASNVSSGSAYMTDIIDGVIWAVRNGADVVNVSYNGIWEPIVGITGEWVVSQGSVLVWAGGNVPIDLTPYATPDVVVVSGTTSTGARWTSSAFGGAIDIAAPAASILLPTMSGGYGNRTGTSYAAGIVSGAIALAWSMRPDLSGEEIVALLCASAKDLGTVGWDPNFGHGQVDVAKLLSMMNSSSHADYNGDGEVDILDLIDFLRDFSEGDPMADLNRDGVVDILDFMEFLQWFSGE